MAILIALALAACGKSNPSHRITLAPLPRTHVFAGAHGPPAAAEIGHSLLTVVKMPEGATVVRSVPSGSAINGVPERSATPNFVDVHRIWRVPGAPRKLIGSIGHSHATGLTLRGSGSAEESRHGHEVGYWWSVSFEAQPQPGMQSEAVVLSATAAPHSGTLVRADGEVVWTTPRPPGEVLPAGVASIEVLAGHPLAELLNHQAEEARHGTHVRTPAHGEVTLRRVISKPAVVRRVIAAFDRLPIVQPGIGSCPAERDGPLAQLVFRDSRGHALARSAQRDGTEIVRCNPMYFRLAGHKQPHLAEGVKFMQLVSQILGVEALPTEGRGHATGQSLTIR